MQGKTVINKLITNCLTYVFKAPIVTFPSMESLVHEQMKNQILMHRMLEAINCVNSQECTDYEAMIYLHTSSLAMPFDREWSRIYIWLFRKHHPKQAENLQLPKIELTPAEQKKLADLKKWIYTIQLENIKRNRGVPDGSE